MILLVFTMGWFGYRFWLNIQDPINELQRKISFLNTRYEKGDFNAEVKLMSGVFDKEVFYIEEKYRIHAQYDLFVSDYSRLVTVRREFIFGEGILMIITFIISIILIT